MRVCALAARTGPSLARSFSPSVLAPCSRLTAPPHAVCACARPPQSVIHKIKQQAGPGALERLGVGNRGSVNVADNDARPNRRSSTMDIEGMPANLTSFGRGQAGGGGAPLNGPQKQDARQQDAKRGGRRAHRGSVTVSGVEVLVDTVKQPTFHEDADDHSASEVFGRKVMRKNRGKGVDPQEREKERERQREREQEKEREKKRHEQDELMYMEEDESASLTERNKQLSKLVHPAAPHTTQHPSAQYDALIAHPTQHPRPCNRPASRTLRVNTTVCVRYCMCRWASCVRRSQS
jgi:hypothetical protein